jgi:uncharacterized spore protein YtfJ
VSAVGDEENTPEGAGGGGGARLNPVGALEISPRGTRFIRFRPLPQLLAVFAVGIATGLMLARRRD